MRHKGKQVFSALTVNGRIHLRRIRWHCPREGCETPLDRIVDVAEQTISQGVREMACRLNRGATSFAMTAENLERAAHLWISRETLRQLIEEEGRRVLAVQRSGQMDPAWKASDCQSPESKTRIYVGCDGVMVPLVTEVEKQKRRQKVREKRRRRGRKSRPLPRPKCGADQAFKEFKLAVLYDQEQKHRYVAGTSGNHAAAGRLLCRMAREVELEQAQERVANVDGAPWIRNELELHGLVDAIGLDYYHLRDNVQRAGSAVYGEHNPEGAVWREQVMGHFHERGYRVAWEHLVAWRSHLRGSRRAAADRLLTYIEERQSMIRYPEFRRHGWQIGSGPTEAQCKSATQRLKGRGRRWDRPNAEALMALDCLANSHAWQHYWATSRTPTI
jgi:hypothetical protein